MPVARDSPWRVWSWPQRASAHRHKAEGGMLKEYRGFSLTGRRLSERKSTRTPRR